MQSVDFYFDFSSTNSYFAAFMLPEICARHGARVNWLPIHLAAIFRETGFDVMAMSPRKARYLWRDHERYAGLTGLPFRRPSRFPIKTAAALRGVLAAARLADPKGEPERSVHAAEKMAEYAQAVFRAYWERDQDISDRAALSAIAGAVNLDPAAMLATIDSPEVRAELAGITQRAVERGVFGAPTFFVADEMFWGKDRLDFVERRLERPARNRSA
jgi:2-hydroxychromene-2-carboxylate isomerase